MLGRWDLYAGTLGYLCWDAGIFMLDGWELPHRSARGQSTRRRTCTAPPVSCPPATRAAPAYSAAGAASRWVRRFRTAAKTLKSMLRVRLPVRVGVHLTLRSRAAARALRRSARRSGRPSPPGSPGAAAPSASRGAAFRVWRAVSLLSCACGALAAFGAPSRSAARRLPPPCAFSLAPPAGGGTPPCGAPVSLLSCACGALAAFGRAVPAE